MALDWTFTDGINAVGSPIDHEVFAEIKANILDVNSRLGPSPADSTFNGLSGRAITIPNQGGTAYLPVITAMGVPTGNVGEIGVVVDSATQFTVYNTGSSSGTFRWKVVK